MSAFRPHFQGRQHKGTQAAFGGGGGVKLYKIRVNGRQGQLFGGRHRERDVAIGREKEKERQRARERERAYYFSLVAN